MLAPFSLVRFFRRQVTGATKKEEAAADAGRGGARGAAAAAGAAGGAGGVAPRLFGSELLYEHPEMLLAVVCTTNSLPLLPERTFCNPVGAVFFRAVQGAIYSSRDIPGT